jgi:TonB family protein
MFEQSIKTQLTNIYPSSKAYENYVNREVVFRSLDENLKTSIVEKEFSVRLVEKEDKNLGSGEFITVTNVKDLTGNEIRKINQILEQIKETGKFLFLSDGTNSFLISSIKESYPVISSLQKSAESNNGVSVPFAVVDEVPTFPGCENALDKKACFQEKMIAHIKKNFNYPKEAQDLGIQGRVSLVFSISTDGTIKNIRKRGPHKLLENEAVRIIERLPKMIPGKDGDKTVDVPFSIPITFKLNTSSTMRSE